jgi:hypothetical protein
MATSSTFDHVTNRDDYRTRPSTNDDAVIEQVIRHG